MLIASYWGVKRMTELKMLAKELGPIILDPYGGSGELIRSVLALGKRAIYNDLNPVATLIAKLNTAFTESDKTELRKCLDAIKPLRSLADRLYAMYCERCRKFVRVTLNTWQNGTCLSHLECGHVVECRDIPGEFRGFLTRNLAYRSDRPFKKAPPVALKNLFTNRNLLLLLLLHDVVLECGELSRLVFISILYASSRMAFIPRSKLSKKGWRPSWAVPAYWLPRTFAEYNPVELFEKTALRVLRAKTRNVRVGTVEDVFKGRARVTFLTSDVLELSLPQSSLDIFTDPPYYDDVQYAELYYFYAVWLGLDFSKVFERELVVNERRGFTYDVYLNTFDRHISKLRELTKEKAFFVLRGDKAFQDLLTVISKHYYVYDVQKTKKNRRGSRVGNAPQQYTYYIIKTTAKR